MAVFGDEDEVYAFLGGSFGGVWRRKVWPDKLANSGVVLRVHYRSDAVVTVDMPNKVVGTRPSTACPTWSCSCRQTREQVLVGEGEPTMAMAKGTVRAKGPVPKLIKLIPQAKNLFPGTG